MDVKLLEIRDRATFIVAMAFALRNRTPEEFWLLRRAGYAAEQIGGPDGHVEPYVVLCKLNGGMDEGHDNPFGWRNQRTMGTAHRYVIEHWSEMNSGDVVDVEHVLGEAERPKVSERFTVPGFTK